MNKLFRIIFMFICFLGIHPTPLSAQWARTSSPFQEVNILAVNGSALFAETNNGIYVSPTEGTLWVEISSDTVKAAAAVVLLPFLESSVVPSIPYDSVLLSLDHGATSFPIDTFLTNEAFLLSVMDSLSAKGCSILDTMQISYNAGQTWLSFDSLPHDVKIYSIAYYYSSILIGTNYGVFVTNQKGTEWMSFNNGLTDTHVRALTVYGMNIFAGTENGVFMFSPYFNAMQWAPFSNGLTNTFITALVSQGSSMLFAGTRGGGVFSCSVVTSGTFPYSVATSGVWSSWNNGLADTYITALALDNTFLFAGTQTSGVWRRNLTELTNVKTASKGVSYQLQLYQNYPNPFNPTTSIPFTVAKSGNAVVKVLDVLGQEVATVFSGEVHAGVVNTVNFNASKLASGVYFSRLESGGNVQIKKMLLMK